MCSIEWCRFRWPWVTPNPSFKVTVWFTGEYLANGASDPLHVWFYAMVFGVGGSNAVISGLMESKMAADGHLGMTALSRVTLASAGLSCECFLKEYKLIYTVSINNIAQQTTCKTTALTALSHSSRGIVITRVCLVCWFVCSFVPLVKISR